MNQDPLTYRKLLEQLKTLSDEQLNCLVTIVEGDNGEPYYYGKLRFADPNDNDILDANHPYLSRD